MDGDATRLPRKLDSAGAIAGALPAGRRYTMRRGRIAIVGEKVLEAVIRLCGISAILFVFGIFFFVVREGVGMLGKLDFGQFLFSTKWYPTSLSNVRYGVLALFVGTASVTVLAMAIAVPFGLGAAIYVSEFCSRRTRETLKIVIELLAAIPSVVWGFIGISVMNPLIQTVFHEPIGLNVFNGALLLALMSVPIMVSIGEDALKAVPDSYREAALALGATRWQTVFRVLLPAAKNGLLAAVLLGVGRAVGETMAVLMATGHAVNIPHSIFEPVRTLTATIAAELGEASNGSDHYQVLFIIGILLFSITFAVNLTADLIVKGIRKK
ncbi:MAG TPA: phosphate ABC transporter permease subunit PstC [Polyangia bacterium]